MKRITWDLHDDEWTALVALVGLMGVGIASPLDVLRVSVGAMCVRYDAPVELDTFALGRQVSLFEIAEVRA